MTDPAVDLDDHLAAAAVADGTIPPEIAEWVAAGAEPDRHDMGGMVTAAIRAEGWTITDDGAASWAMGKLAAAQAELDAIGAAYRARLAQLNDWREVRAARSARTAEFMEAKLAAYALALRSADPEAKTLRLPEGRVETRQPAQAYTVEVLNADAVLAWALANQREEMVRPTLVTKTDLRARVVVAEREDGPVVVDVESGEVVPGLTAEPTKATVTIKPAVRT